MPVRSLALIACALTGCSTMMRVGYTRDARPRLVTIQLQASTVENGSSEDVYRFDESWMVEAGCLRAAFDLGMHVAWWRTDPAVTHDSASSDAVQLGRLTGANTVVAGTARLNPQSLQVIDLRLEARDGATGGLQAEARMRDDGGAEPVEAGRRLCMALLGGWHK